MTSDKQEIAEDCPPKKYLKEKCKEMGAISLSQFEKEFWDAFNEVYRKYGVTIKKT